MYRCARSKESSKGLQSLSARSCAMETLRAHIEEDSSNHGLAVDSFEFSFIAVATTRVWAWSSSEISSELQRGQWCSILDVIRLCHVCIVFVKRQSLLQVQGVKKAEAVVQRFQLCFPSTERQSQVALITIMFSNGRLAHPLALSEPGCMLQGQLIRAARGPSCSEKHP